MLAIALSCMSLLACEEPPPVPAAILDSVSLEPATVTLGSRSAYVFVARVPNGFFQNTARPVMGRTFAQGEFSGSITVCIISYSLWERFGAGESAAPLVLGSTRLEVIGVMPDDFDIPGDAAVWIPLILPPS